jgi:hypothetical protein
MTAALKYRMRIWLGVIGFVWLGFGKLLSQDLDVPIDLQVPLMLKATTYDRNFASKNQVQGVVQIGICYQSKFRKSLIEMEALKEQFSKPVAGFKIQIVLMDLAEGQDLGKRKEWAQLSIVYLTSMRGIDLDAIRTQTNGYDILSVCTDPAWVQKGITIGFELLGGRPHFVINRKNAVEEGCDFSSQLLKLATIY